MLRSSVQQQQLARRCPRGVPQLAIRAAVSQQWKATQRHLVARAEPEGQAPGSAPGGVIGMDSNSETAKKKAEADRLRAAEQFMVVGQGKATCKSCGYEYKPENGDPEYPIPRGMKFQELPAEYVCPVCGADKSKFEADAKVVAGFAANQGYGFGTNSMTGDQKLLLIYGSLFVFFLLFLAGYALE